MAGSLSSFSKVGDLLEEDDEEEERRRISEAAVARFRAAEHAYTSKGSKEEVLKLFEAAEACMAPLLGSGLMALGAQELQIVLRGRLHQAVILAQIEHIPDRWSKVKKLAEDVLQFDFGNCHGHWLRALALQNTGGGGRSAEAEAEMRNAIDYARSQGKLAEVDQWQAELQRFISASDADASRTSEAVDEDATAEVHAANTASDQQVELPHTRGKITAESQPGLTGEKAPALQKGFLNKRSSKTPVVAQATTPAGSALPAAGTASNARDEAESSKARASSPSCQAGLNEEAHELLREQRRQLEEQRGQLDTLRRQLQEEHQRLQDQREESLRWQHSLKGQMDAIGAEFEQALTGEAAAVEGQNAAAAVRAARESREVGSLRRALVAAAEVKELQQSGRAWSEAQHQRYVEISTELLTLQEMCKREHRERQDTSKQRAAEMRDLAKRMHDLKAAAKTLRDHVRLKAAGAPHGDEKEHDVQRLAESAADFRALSLRAKLMAFADDGAVLRLMGLAVLLGMLLMLGFVAEGFSRYRCRFVCSG